MFKRFKRNTDGNVAMMFSVSVLALLTAVGAAIDYSGATRQKQSLQDIVDAATLAAAKANSTDLTELNKIVDQIIAKHNSGNTADGARITYQVQVVDDEVVVTGSSTYDTFIMGIVGTDQLGVSAVAAAPVAGTTPVKIALVLDTTESMSGADIAAVKTATNSLLNELEDFETPVAVSVVPFGQYVNVGTSRRGETWLDTGRDGESDTAQVCRDDTITVSPRVCTKTGRRVQRDIIRDGRFFGVQDEEEETCTRAIRQNTGTQTCSTETTTYTWHGCVGSRQAPLDEQASFGSTRIKGIINETCGTELQELTTSFTQVRSTIQNLSVSGNTYLPSGLMWGWRTLQDEQPLKTNVDLSTPSGIVKDPVNVMIFMTDGSNTLSQGGNGSDEDHHHEDNDENAANAKTRALCEAAKLDGVQIFTIGYRMTGADSDTQQLLTSCASSPSQYHDAANASELEQVFKDLAGSLSFARLSI